VSGAIYSLSLGVHVLPRSGVSRGESVSHLTPHANPKRANAERRKWWLVASTIVAERRRFTCRVAEQQQVNAATTWKIQTKVARGRETNRRVRGTAATTAVT